jgi:hypothetical protein
MAKMCHRDASSHEKANKKKDKAIKGTEIKEKGEGDMEER